MTPTRFLTAASAIALSAVGFVPATAQAAGTWATTLEGLDLNSAQAGFEAYYDSRLNITWLTDTTAIQNTAYAWEDQGHATPLAHFDDATAWTSGLSVGTGNDWRLPTMTEFGDMYYTTLGNTSNVLTQRGPFANLGVFRPYNDWIGAYVWTSTTSGSIIRTFGLDGYGWNIATNNNPNIAWAVHQGRVLPSAVSAVPEPPTWALLLLGAPALWRRRRHS